MSRPSPSRIGPRAARPLVLAVHGTRSPRGTATSVELADAVARRTGADVHLGWVDIHTPTLTDTLRRLGAVVVVPVFLTRGYHVTSDLPAAIAAAGGLATSTPLVGDDVLPAVVDRLQAVGEADAIVLAGAGSLRPRAVADVHDAAGRLATITGRPVEVGFVTAASPTVMEAVAAARASSAGRVVIAPYLLAPGRFSDLLAESGADAVAEVIGVHPLLIDLIVQRWLSASERTPLDAQPKAVND